MKYFQIIIFSIIIFSCIENKKESQSFNINYDKIDHYHLNTETSKIYNGLAHKEKEILNEILYSASPSSINDLTAINIIESQSEKKTIDSKFNSEIVKSVSLHEINQNEEQPITSCEPIYRDILIFRKENKITSIIKICFDCSENQVLGINFDSSKYFFGVNYKKLKKLL
ncbi:MAG: hypothetical protein L6Q46_05265 [Flavobacterium sp.]|uniref:hypothetical protein n=1 Tax=Flavobacterium sp. TaxID=239 RepID=UPI0025B8D37D|nr:hypothetical protein [Flavobacterium sp.]MCK6607700.1 hypothetical protein [Flavobacterium sp.]